MAARNRAEGANRKTRVAAAVRQRKQKAASTELLQPALDPGVAPEAQREEIVTRRDAAAAEEGLIVSTLRYQVRTKTHSLSVKLGIIIIFYNFNQLPLVPRLPRN